MVVPLVSYLPNDLNDAVCLPTFSAIADYDIALGTLRINRGCDALNIVK